MTPTSPELTARALIAGIVIGALLTVTNVYLGLKAGILDSGNITAAVLAFAMLSALGARRGAGSTPLENNLAHVVASAMAGMPGTAGLVDVLPSLALIGLAVAPGAMVAWALALGASGVLLALLVQRRLLAEEALPFPTGVATAEVIRAMHTAGRAALGRARALVASATGTALLVWLRDGAGWLPQVLAFPGQLAGVPAASLTLGVSVSPVMLGVGLLVGPRAGASILLGATVAWAGLAPWLIARGAVARPDFEALSGWLMWPGAALMVSSALTSFASRAGLLVRGLRDLRAISGREGPLPRASVALALLAWALVALVGWRVFGMHPLLALGALALSVPLAVACARAAGETDIAPVGAVGQLSQLTLGVLGGARGAPGVAPASVVTGHATQVTHSLWALKAGHVLGASLRAQALALFVGMGAGALVGIPAYALLTRAYGLCTEGLPAPAARVWTAVAELLAQGGTTMPRYAAAAAAIAFVLGTALTLLKGRLVPSPMALSVGFIAPAHYAAAIALGAFALALARARRPAPTEAYAPGLGAGAIAGESLMGVALALAAVARTLP